MKSTANTLIMNYLWTNLFEFSLSQTLPDIIYCFVWENYVNPKFTLRLEIFSQFISSQWTFATWSFGHNNVRWFDRILEIFEGEVVCFYHCENVITRFRSKTEVGNFREKGTIIIVMEGLSGLRTFCVLHERHPWLWKEGT